MNGHIGIHKIENCMARTILRVGEYDEWRTTVILFLVKNSLLRKEM
jgi:hypothetical protein